MKPLRYGLRTLFVIAIVIGIVSGIVGNRYQKYHANRDLIDRIQIIGGRIEVRPNKLTSLEIVNCRIDPPSIQSCLTLQPNASIIFSYRKGNFSFLTNCLGR